jgi:triacylglycerol esterase/lipase EstA (alpha/beta hydrolase family)
MTFNFLKLIVPTRALMLFLVSLACGLGTARAAPDDSGKLADGTGKSLATKWPIVLSHPFSFTAERAFRGDQLGTDGKFDAYGVKTALEAAGAVVYQPDKVAFGSNELRGQLLYRRCAGTTTKELLCEGSAPTVVDGIEHATVQYCSDPSLRARSGFSTEQACRSGLKFNVICHSQGCPDSRYMLAAVRQSFSGQLMYRHVASWSSLAGANKGTELGDFFVKASGTCTTDACRASLLDAVLGVTGLASNGYLLANSGDSVVALSRKYMLDSTDIGCTKSLLHSCPPSFNERYHLPVDAAYPVLYQTFNTVISDRKHPCFNDLRTSLQMALLDSTEGPNDGYISLESQAFTTYGRDGSGGATPVVPRFITGTSSDPARPHPGLNHLAFANTKIPGLNGGGLSCAGENNSHLRFSRIGVFRDIVAELVERGF